MTEEQAKDIANKLVDAFWDEIEITTQEAKRCAILHCTLIQQNITNHYLIGEYLDWQQIKEQIQKL